MYLCRDCSHVFRASDREKSERRQGERRQGTEYSRETVSFRAGSIGGTALDRALSSYRIAFVSVLAGTTLGQATVWLNGTAPMGFFIAAVVVSAGNGIFAGFLAIVLSLFVMLAMFRENLSIALATQNMLALFVVIGIVTNLVFYKLHLRNKALDNAKAALEAVNQELRDHAKALADANAQLAEQKVSLLSAHEHLRLLSKGLTRNMRAPLNRISLTSEMLVASDLARFNASLSDASDLIKIEVQRMDALVEDFAHAC
jgi:signal transduction histidine kinase